MVAPANNPLAMEMAMIPQGPASNGSCCMDACMVSPSMENCAPGIRSDTPSTARAYTGISSHPIHHQRSEQHACRRCLVGIRLRYLHPTEMNGQSYSDHGQEGPQDKYNQSLSLHHMH